jgi:hypothetical protein
MVALGRRSDARVLLDQDLANGTLKDAPPLELAYLASSVGAEDLARSYFKRAEAAGSLSGPAILDAAYNARQVDDRNAASALFRTALDENRSGRLPLDQQSRLNITREVASLERVTGGYISVARSPTGAFAGASPGSRDATFAGGEIFWRPPLNWQRSRMDVFARAFLTADADEGASGPETLQGYIGARVQPFIEYDLVFEGRYLFPLGKDARTDWLARAAYSTGAGGDIRLDASTWTDWNLYGEAGYFLRTDQTIANIEGRYGQAFRLGGVREYSMITPFVGTRLSYDSSLQRELSLGVGPGLAYRYGIGANAWRAPAAYLDLMLQYRFRVLGGEQGEGLSAGATLSY